jgi:uncharacterized protein (DUF983 family)
MDPASHGIFKRLWAALRFRCPRCCTGSVWRAPFRMRDACPACGLVFEREPGYFVGAMYASYFLGIFLTLPVWMGMLLGGAGLAPILIVAIGMVVVLTPLSFHYSRVLWMHIDCYFNPKTFLADVPR